MYSDLDKYFPLRCNRSHEVMGPSAVSFAAIMCGLGKRSAFWFSEHWQREHLNPAGLAEFCDPQKIIMGRGKGQLDVLAASEEALRSGAVSVVVGELSKPLSLTMGRRLQLAAEAGRTTGIFLISDGMGSNAAETRWHCAPVFDHEGSTLQRWKLIKNKIGTLKTWEVRWDAEARCIIVVSETGERAHSARVSS